MRSDSMKLFILRDSAQSQKVAAMKRKREKLDHLSEEEKLLRRKIKNRISAQTARDRKKQKLRELEIRVEQLSKANSMLLKRNQELEEENAALRNQSPKIGSESPSLFGEQTMNGSLESAAFINGSLQKNQESYLESSPIWIRILISLLMTMIAMKSSSGYINVPKTFSKMILSHLARNHSILIREILIWIKKLRKSRSRAGNMMFLLG